MIKSRIVPTFVSTSSTSINVIFATVLISLNALCTYTFWDSVREIGLLVNEWSGRAKKSELDNALLSAKLKETTVEPLIDLNLLNIDH